MANRGIKLGMKKLKLYLITFFLLLSSMANADLLIGVHPYLNAELLIERFQPLANYLSLKLDTNVKVRVGKDYESHIQAIGRNTLDIAYLGPSSYVKLVRQYEKKPLLARLEANGKSTFSGYIIVREDNKLTDLEQLENHFFAFGDQNSTMSRLVPQAMLQQKGISLDKLSGYRYFKGHKNVAMAVLSGDADAGAVKEEIFHQFSNKGIRSLAKSPDISEHLFVTSSDMDPALQKQIRELLLDIKQPTQVAKLLKPIKKKLTGLVPVNDSDYNSLRELMELVE